MIQKTKILDKTSLFIKKNISFNFKSIALQIVWQKFKFKQTKTNQLLKRAMTWLFKNLDC